MNLILFCHPGFMDSQSMPRFARMLEQAYHARGYRVTIWAPRAMAYRLLPHGRLSKWLGYIDQYILFPLWVRRQLKKQPKDTLYVFCDQALGPWVPLVKNRPHIVHVHDLLALRSALGDVPENPTSWSGRLYQRYIRWGFRQARHFIAISNKSRDDLHHFGRVMPTTSEVVYNGLNYPYAPMPADEARTALMQAGLPADGMLLHISGDQWYKNVAGVIRVYAHYARGQAQPLPLCLVGPKPNGRLEKVLAEVPTQGSVRFFHGLDTRVLQAAYSTAGAFLFPSLAEGFGWPIVEAMACGCPVITTDEPPMNEVGGAVAAYLPRLKAEDDADVWAANGARILESILDADRLAREKRAAEGIAWAARFNAGAAIAGYLEVYARVLARQQGRAQAEPADGGGA